MHLASWDAIGYSTFLVNSQVMLKLLAFSDAVKHYMKGRSDPTVKNYLSLIAIGTCTEKLKISGPKD